MLLVISDYATSRTSASVQGEKGKGEGDERRDNVSLTISDCISGCQMVFTNEQTIRKLMTIVMTGTW